MESKRNQPPEFEFDERKSRLNKLKHGIDFVEAQALWLKTRRSLEGRGGGPEEPRFLRDRPNRRQALVGSGHLSRTSVRLISVRRSRAKEVQAHMKASDFDKKFDDGVEDVIDDLDPSSWRTTQPGSHDASTSTSPSGWSSRSIAKPSVWASPASRSSRCGSPRSWSSSRRRAE